MAVKCEETLFFQLEEGVALHAEDEKGQVHGGDGREET